MSIFKIKRCDTRERHRSHRGYAICVSADGVRYFVTAAHVVLCSFPEDPIYLQFGDYWIELPNTLVSAYGDIAVFRLNDNLPSNFRLEDLSSDALEIGQEVFYVAPEDVSGKLKGKWVGYSDAPFSPTNERELCFEGYSQPGMSGTPICYRPKDDPCNLRIAALLTGLEFDTEKGFYKVRGCDVRFAVEAIKADLIQTRFPAK